MNNSIVETGRYVEDLGLIYIPETDKTGIHLRGLAGMLDCEPKTLLKLKQRCYPDHVIEARIQTLGGVQGVTFVLEGGVVDILEQIIDSTRIKIDTRRRARSVFKDFARAGFKLYALMQVAPERLGMSATSVEESVERKPKGLISLDRAQLRDLWIYQEAASSGVSPDAELAAKIDPDFFGVTVEAARYAFYLKDLQYNEDALASQRVSRDLWLTSEIARADEREDLEYVADSKVTIKRMEALGYHLAAAAFDSAYQSLRGDRQLALRR